MSMCVFIGNCLVYALEVSLSICGLGFKFVDFLCKSSDVYYIELKSHHLKIHSFTYHMRY